MNIASLMKKKTEMMAELREHGATALKEEFKSFFAAHPECIALRWRQYTPYFNDGEACEFSRHDIGVKLTDTPEDASDGYDEEGFEDTYSDRRDEELFKSVLAAVKVLEAIDEEIFEIAFGDHVKVTATRAGFDVEEYSHG